jgi:2Fe-2S ferredoxin
MVFSLIRASISPPRWRLKLRLRDQSRRCYPLIVHPPHHTVPRPKLSGETDVPTLIVTDTKGVTRSVQSAPGRSVMEVIRTNGFDDLLALCGGCCSCATCHVHVDPDDFAKVGSPNPDEADLLDGSSELSPTSRLSCQIAFTDALDGLRVTIAKEG